MSQMNFTYPTYVGAITLNIIPKPTPRPKIAMRGKFPTAYYPKEYAKYKDDLALLIRSNRIKKLNYGRIKVTFYLAYPKSTAKKRLIDQSPHQKKPDLDNFMKGLLDGLEQAKVIENDSQFYIIEAKKLYTTFQPRIVFEID